MPCLVMISFPIEGKQFAFFPAFLFFSRNNTADVWQKQHIERQTHQQLIPIEILLNKVTLYWGKKKKDEKICCKRQW